MAQAAEVGGLTDAIRKLDAQGNPALVASAMEFIFEGLHLHRGDVEGVVQGVHGQQRAVLVEVGVLGDVPAPEVGRRIHQHGRHIDLARLEGRRVGDRLERGTDLAASKARHVELPLHARVLAVVVVDAADVRDDLAGRRVECYQRPVVHVLGLELVDPAAHLGLGGLLQAVVQRGDHPEAAGPELLCRVLIAELGQDLLCLALHPEAELRLLEDARHPRRMHLLPGRGDRLVVLDLGDVAVGQHRVEHLVAPRDHRRGPAGVLVWVVGGRLLRNPRQEGGLRQGELAQVGDPEVVRGGCLDPV